MKDKLQIFLPGILLAATGVGAGDLITGTLAGVHVGLVCIFAPLFGALLKYSLNESLARYQIATDRTLLEGWISHFGRFFHLIFIIYLFIWSYSVGGALISACGVAMDAILPLGDFKTSKIIWGIIQSLLGLAIVFWFDYDKFSKIISFLIGIMFVGVIITTLFLLPSLDLWSQSFVNFSLDDRSLNWIVGSIGGVGGTLTILSYGYWIREDKRKGREGLAKCQTDLKGAYLVMAIFSVAMIILGDQLPLSGQKEARFSLVLAEKLSSTLGPLGGWIFKLGFWAGVFSSLIGVFQSVPYIFSDYVHSLKKQSTSHHSETSYYRGFALFLALAPMLTLHLKLEFVQLTYAILGALFMPFLALSLLILNNFKIKDGYKNDWLQNSLHMATLLFFAFVALYKFLK